ncbi:type 1 fimbrial protein [Pseudomonas palleroniana]|uniref:type 1 fimbrial protein n=1 Tax=Pseudomonas palleroniana TaxID=191390 RepID=UPI0018E69D20|nr:type 1 fimbrial protein [Pseudomonas palleroniana]MBI6910228.1 type 1 fimbrial protein [Pseudomonas palleroniana]UOP10832.1 type 1 fimbrial protein [Pseudomonas palleroniana]
MNVIRLSVVTGLLAVWAGTCMAASSGVIQFHGSIVEPGCNSATPGGSTVAFNGCPQAMRGSRFEVQPVGSVQALGNATANVKLVADSSNGRYYDQRYLLVDAGGKPIQSGAYIVTMTAP